VGALQHKTAPEPPENMQRTDQPRLALSHNLLTTLPRRLIECKRLRYLNVRYNAMREIPDAVRRPSLASPDLEH
jgi:hypothetical protein